MGKSFATFWQKEENNMDSKELNTLLLHTFPELKEEFEEETSWQDGIETGSFIVFENVFMPFLELNVELNNTEMIERIYSFIEDLSNIDDKYVENVLYVAILENILSYVNPDPFIKPLKNNSKKIFDDNYKTKIVL